ncbi:MAG: succinate dehydrogenase cytochrome b subunit [Vicinamibacterales bacterium]
MSQRNRVFDSSVGSKLLIGLTGLFLVLYLLIHIAGNLMIFGGQAFFNGYAGALASNPLIPLIEVVLLIGILVHVYKTIRMFISNKAARPVAYAMKKTAGHTSRKTFASSTMILSGLWLLVFLVVHVKAFKFGAHYEAPGGGADLYRVEMENFRHPLMVLFYVVSMLVVGSHLFHGASSAAQSIGLSHPRWTPKILLVGKLLAIGVAGGFIVIALWAHFTANQLGAA